jgi:coenzyme F420-reducing hydrogenase delta subunit/ferredoxin
MCTGRIDLAFVLRAFSRGADGVLIAGCRMNECNYSTHGNFYALSMVHLCKKLMQQIGANPDRLRIELLSGGEASRFADLVNHFSNIIHELGPLGSSEGIGVGELKSRTEEISRLVPYIKLTEKDKLQARLQTEEEYSDLYTQDEVEQLLHRAPSYYIDPDRCQACMVCAKRCPVEAIAGGKSRIHVIDQNKCIKCGMCLEVCPPRFGAVISLPGEPAPPPIPEGERFIDRKRRRG